MIQQLTRSATRSMLVAVLMFVGCGSSSKPAVDAGDASSVDTKFSNASSVDINYVPPRNSSNDSGTICTYPDGGVPMDGGAFSSFCPSAGCPTGTVCVGEVGGVAGGGGDYCAPIPNECHGIPTCACMASCVCTNGFGGRPETCTERLGSIACDNGIR